MIEKRVGPLYQSYSKDTDRDRLPLLFRARHGYDPAEVKDGKTVWLVGPIVAEIEEEPEEDPEPERGGDLLRAVAQVGDRMTAERARVLVGEQLALGLEV
jgi:hypothetical protein